MENYESLSRALLEWINQLSDTFKVLPKQKRLSKTEGKILILSILHKIIDDNRIANSSALLSQVTQGFCNSLRRKEIRTIHKHSDSIDKFVTDRIHFYLMEWDNVRNGVRGTVPMGSSYCLYSDPLGKLEYLMVDEKRYGFAQKYSFTNLPLITQLNQLYVSIYEQSLDLVTDLFSGKINFPTNAQPNSQNEADEYGEKGLDCRRQGDNETALVYFTKAIDLRPDLTKYFNRANTNFSLKKFENCISDCNKALEFDKQCYQAYNLRGNAYQGLGRLDLALTDINKAISLKIDDWKIYKVRAWLHMKLDNPSKAIEDFTRVIELHNDGQSYYYRGLSKSRIGDVDGLISDHKLATELGFDPLDED